MAFLRTLTTLFYEARAFTRLELDNLVRLAGQKASGICVLGGVALGTTLVFVWVLDLNSCPHTFIASTLPSELSQSLRWSL